MQSENKTRFEIIDLDHIKKYKVKQFDFVTWIEDISNLKVLCLFRIILQVQTLKIVPTLHVLGLYIP